VGKILARKPERKRPHRRHGYKWEGNIILDLREIVWDGVDRMHLAEDRNQPWAFVNMVMNLWIP
jgi:hypothetical protein